MRTKVFPVMILAMLLTLAMACGRGEAKREQVVFPLVVPDEGSEEAAVLVVFERVIRALRTDDWEGYIENCDPSLSPLMTVAQVESMSITLNGYHEMSGLNARNVAFRYLSDETSLVNADFYSGDDLGYPGAQYSWSKANGRWYLNSNCTVRG